MMKKIILSLLLLVVLVIVFLATFERPLPTCRFDDDAKVFGQTLVQVLGPTDGLEGYRPLGNVTVTMLSIKDLEVQGLSNRNIMLSKDPKTRVQLTTTSDRRGCYSFDELYEDSVVCTVGLSYYCQRISSDGNNFTLARRTHGYYPSDIEIPLSLVEQFSIQRNPFWIGDTIRMSVGEERSFQGLFYNHYTENRTVFLEIEECKDAYGPITEYKHSIISKPKNVEKESLAKLDYVFVAQTHTIVGRSDSCTVNLISGDEVLATRTVRVIMR